MKAKILVIEDDKKINGIILSYLENEGYATASAFDGHSGLERYRTENPDLIILDLMLPEIDGLEITREIRKKSDVPIIMLTARVDEIDKVIGLEIGADDYVAKPFAPRELMARVKAVLRRSGCEREEETLSFDRLTIDLIKHAVSLNGSLLELTPTEFSLLVKLAGQPGRVYSRKQLLETIQDVAFEGYERTVDAHIKNLRKKMRSADPVADYIKTVHGIGYKFEDIDE